MKLETFIRAAVLAVVGYFTFYWVGATGGESVFVEQPWLWVVLGVIVLFYIAGEACVNALESVLYRSLPPDRQRVYDENLASAKARKAKYFSKLYKKVEGSKPIEEEDEIILDHNYDGIRELDNKLPPWWVYSFYATIIFAVVYMARFHVFDGVDQDQEYEAAVAQAQIEIEEYKRTAKDLVDVNTVTFLADVSDLTAGEKIFQGNCVACHKVTGGGGIGPNLTDDHWILGGGIKNVFNTISEGGRSGKGMVAWKTDLKPAEMAQVASYVLTLHGTNPPDGKAPEGEIWLDPDAPVEEVQVQVIDSTTVEVLIEDQPVTGDVIKDNP
ncbi:MAG: cbb3-type cytochrome c oxidase N-terminal domain-containing protein [Nonlabens sp.]